MLLNKVVVGKGQIVNQDSPNLTAPSPGFDSVGVSCPQRVFIKHLLGSWRAGKWGATKLR